MFFRDLRFQYSVRPGTGDFRVLKAYWWIALASVLMSWLDPDPYNPVVRFVRSLTDPVFDFFRRMLPFLRAGAVDLSPIAVFLLIMFLERALVGTLLELAARVKLP